MDENDGKEFKELGVKTWLVKQLFTLGMSYVFVFMLLVVLFNKKGPL